MSIISRVEFAAIVGKSPAYISVNIKRNNVVLVVDGDDDGNIDTENVINKRFIRHIKKISKKDKPVTYKDVVETVETSVKNNKQNSETKETRKAKAEQRKKAKDMLEFEYRKKKAEASKSESDADLKSLAVEKMMGKLMPVELVHQIIKINIQGVFISFENELQNIASIYCDILAGGDRKKLAEIVEQMRENLSRIITDTKVNTDSEIKQVIENYAETRNRGEKK